MNYLTLINRFWQHRRSKRVTSLQADLYYFLIQECNGKDWENPFECSNVLICASIGITEKTLIDARNKLKQEGLIDFQAGQTKKKSPVYYLLEYWNKVSKKESIVDSIPVGNSVSNPVGNQWGNEQTTLLLDTKQNKTKQEREKHPFLFPEEAKEIIDYLNKKTGKKFQSTSGVVKRSITARMNEKRSVSDFKKVIDIKSAEWLREKKMMKYLCPETLFGEKFEKYLNEVPEPVDSTEGHLLYSKLNPDANKW